MKRSRFANKKAWKNAEDLRAHFPSIQPKNDIDGKKIVFFQALLILFKNVFHPIFY